MLALERGDQRKRRAHRDFLGRRSVDPGTHRVEEDVGEAAAEPSVAELAQALVRGVAARRHEQLAEHANFLCGRQQWRSQKRAGRFRQPLQAIRVDIAFAREVGARHQDVLRVAVRNEFEELRLVAEESVRGGLEPEAL